MVFRQRALSPLCKALRELQQSQDDLLFASLQGSFATTAYSLANTHRMPSVAGHSPEKSHSL